MTWAHISRSGLNGHLESPNGGSDLSNDKTQETHKLFHMFLFGLVSHLISYKQPVPAHQVALCM